MIDKKITIIQLMIGGTKYFLQIKFLNIPNKYYLNKKIWEIRQTIFNILFRII